MGEAEAHIGLKRFHSFAMPLRHPQSARLALFNQIPVAFNTKTTWLDRFFRFFFHVHLNEIQILFGGGSGFDLF